MQLHTPVPVNPIENPLSYQAKVFSMGSCFAEHMNEKLRYYGFDSDANPFGIIFNALSMQRLVARIVQEQAFTEADIFFHNELWQSYEVHSRWSTTEAERYIHQLNSLLFTAHEQLVQATHFILTLGTSWVYTFANQVVANCHKVPNVQFEKRLLTAEDTEGALAEIMRLVRQINPKIQFVFTVSPVRHTKDGFTENHISKGNLLQAIYNLKQNDNKWYYFPAYEIMMDELRDYRFFAADLIHPNALAIDYIWERFSTQMMTPHTIHIMGELQSLQRVLQHRPQHQDTAAWVQFQHFKQTQLAQFKERYPEVLWSELES